MSMQNLVFLWDYISKTVIMDAIHIHKVVCEWVLLSHLLREARTDLNQI